MHVKQASEKQQGRERNRPIRRENLILIKLKLNLIKLEYIFTFDFEYILNFEYYMYFIQYQIRKLKQLTVPNKLLSNDLLPTSSNAYLIFVI